MRPDLEEKLWIAGSGEKFDELTCRAIIQDLLGDLAAHIPEGFVRDTEVWFDPMASAFSTWIWSQSGAPSSLAVTWSGVLAGGPVGDPNDEDSFAVTVDIFLFHEP